MGRGNRRRLVLLFAALLLACSTAPVIADSSAPLEGQVVEAAGDDPERYFDGDTIVPVDLEAVADEEAEREEWLASPEAEQQREASWGAYGDLSPADSEELLQSAFAEQLQTLNDDPARFLSDAHLIRPLEETAAAVKEDGEYFLLDAGIPVRMEDEDGESAKVELSLEPTQEGYEPANGLVDVTLPFAADETAEVGEEGFAISQAAADPSAARRFGDKNLFYPDVLPDTDLLAAPTSGGLELFNLLRSEVSPEDLRFAIDVPEGAMLRSDGSGGAEVVRDGEILTRIATPAATDAQGTEVPVELTVEPNAVVLHVDHRGGDLAAPILVDPIVEDWANNPNNWYLTNNKWDALTNGAWVYKSNSSQLKGWICCWEGSHAGLMISSEKHVFYGAKQFGQWSYSTANAKTYITHAWLTPFWRNDESCGSSSEPHDYVGMLWEPGEVWNPVVSDKGKTGTYSLDGNGQAFIIGMGTGNGVWIGCNRYTYAGGVALWLDDQWTPVVNAPTLTPSNGWVSDTGAITIGVNANDEGLGVYRATVTPEGKAAISKTTGCTGLYGNRCPNATSVNFSLTGLSFGEGVRENGVSAEDPSGKAAAGPKFQTKVDRTSPEVTLSGQLAQATNEGGGSEQPAGQGDELVLPVYNLNIDATDGSNQTNLARRSGVKNIEVFLDGVKQGVPWTAQTATEDSRPMNKTYELKLSTMTTAGDHTLEVKVRDQVENVRERKIEFEYFPATGMKDEYVMQYFPLPDGSGNEAEEEHPARPELAVNVMNGNLVYREQDIDINGAGADLEVERFYNSMLPTAENTEWGDGWTLAETPELDPISSSQADVVESSGAIEDKVALPTEVGASKFDPVLQATIEKKVSGGYELTDETGESSTSVSFDSTGQAEALLTDGYAKVDYSYESGDLAEIEVEDPATFSGEPEIPEPQLVTAPTFGSFFGANGSGNGQFKSPADVAVDKQGNLWVADRTNNRLEQFSEDGEFVQAVGALGTAGGKLSAPAGVAVDGSGNVWVADTGNNRVEQFNQKGEFVLVFGKDVNKTKVTAGAPESERNLCTAASGNTCQAGVAGSAAGQLKAPQGIAATSGGNVWIADTGNSRLQKFSPAGSLINNISGYGSEAGKLKEPASIAVGPDGSIWVADTVNNRIQQWNSSLALVRTFGTEGVGNNQFKRPAGIDVDADGNVWVADQLNNRIQLFDSSAQFLAKYGSAGSGDGQFNFASATGVAADSKGHLWVVDSGNNRVQEWLLPVEKPTYVYTFGSNGSGDGQMKAPADVALGLGGALWVADKGNNRIEKFDARGQYLAKFGSLGTGDGQFNRPAAIDVDRDGNLLVIDSSNNRIQKFDASGQFISKFGAAGTGTGQFATPEGVAADFEGNIWVADTDNGRLQKFDEEGKFLKVVGSKGSGSGQLGEPAGLDIDPEGNVWVADWLNNRISAFSPEGAFLGSFGTAGSGPGQFNHPDEVEIDSHGNVWVGDQTNNRVQRFNLKGEYVGQFGSSGSGEGNLSLAFPMGIAADPLGRIWATDPNNNRIQKWMLGNYSLATPALDLSDGDPAVSVETPGGLVSKVSGNAAGSHTYVHVGDDLTAHNGPAGEAKYEYDASGRMTKVTLPNGTWGSIAYQTDGRVKSVTVDPAGADPSKTTSFEYSDSPRRTVVVPQDAPHVTYDIGDDGSVLKWWNALQPPVFDDLAGGLYENRNKEDGLLPGDQHLDITAHSEEGISSIEVIVNGSQLVHETTCDQTEAPEIECLTVSSEWVSNTETVAPGHLNIEVVLTDRLGSHASERFWVDIPEPPPPPAPGSPIPPKFADVLQFREDYGLEKVFPVANEIERNERIFNLINAWYEGEPVARASWERWGVPLRPVDVAEMEYREWYLEENATKIMSWASSNAPTAYAGYRVDNRAGGIMYVGFTENQTAIVAALKASGLPVATARIEPDPVVPTRSLELLVGIAKAISTEAPPTSTIVDGGMTYNRIEIGAENVGAAQSWITARFGSGVPVSIYESGRWHPAKLPAPRYWTREGPLYGGQAFGHTVTVEEKPGITFCSVGFGAAENAGTNANGQAVNRYFALTAGHCFEKGKQVGRWNGQGAPKPTFDKVSPSIVGTVKRRSIETTVENYSTDTEAVLLNDAIDPPRTLLSGRGVDLKITGITKAVTGMPVCAAGSRSERMRHGEIKGTHWLNVVEEDSKGNTHVYPRNWEPIAQMIIEPGDSGGPVWRCGTGQAVGLLSAFNGHGYLTGIAPLLSPERAEQNEVEAKYFPYSKAQAPGVLRAPEMGDIHLTYAK